MGLNEISLGEAINRQGLLDVIRIRIIIGLEVLKVAIRLGPDGVDPEVIMDVV